eukprot:2784060-Rhodomonas_salina.1
MPCPVLTQHTLTMLRTRYAMPCTTIASPHRVQYLHSPPLYVSGYWHIVLSSCYAMSGTDVGDGARGWGGCVAQVRSETARSPTGRLLYYPTRSRILFGTNEG